MEKNLKEIGESSSTSAASLLPVHLLELHLLSPPNLGQNQARILTLMLLVGYGCVHRGFKALKQSTKLLYCVLLRPQEALKTYIELLSYTTSAVTRNCEQAPSVLSYLRSKKPARSASEVGAGELVESLSPPFLASSSSSSFPFLSSSPSIVDKTPKNPSTTSSTTLVGKGKVTESRRIWRRWRSFTRSPRRVWRRVRMRSVARLLSPLSFASRTLS